MTRHEPRLLLRALALRALLPVLLRAWTLDRVLSRLGRSSRRGPSGRAPLSALERVTDLVTRRLPLSRTACLQRALLRYALLCEQGYAPVFVIGVRPGGPDGFEAHAWVELGGTPVMEREPQAYTRSYTHPAASAPGLR